MSVLHPVSDILLANNFVIMVQLSSGCPLPSLVTSAAAAAAGVQQPVGAACLAVQQHHAAADQPYDDSPQHAASTPA
jgi:hypothetical protein